MNVIALIVTNGKTYISGGLFMFFSTRLAPLLYFRYVLESIALRDVITGLIKSLAFATILMSAASKVFGYCGRRELSRSMVRCRCFVKNTANASSYSNRRSLKSIETISISRIGRRSDPRV